MTKLDLPAVDVAALDPVLDFMRLLWRIEHALQSTSKRMEASLGVTGPQRLVLKIVATFPGLSAGDLAHVVRLHPSTVTGIVQRLVKKGLLERQRDSADSRRILLHLRPQGRRFARRSNGPIESAVTVALTQVPPAQLRHARSVLVAIAAALEESGGSIRNEPPAGARARSGRPARRR